MIQNNWQELIKPAKLDIVPGANPARTATIVAEPLERGFGLTLGNALRRVLLSSLQGAAVTAVQIEGVLHEFSSVPGVREDVTDIVLNIKSMGLRMHSEGPRRMTLKAEGPGEVKASAIDTGHDIDIMDPDLVICTLDDGAKMSMELTVESGKGYVAASLNRPEESPIGLIPVDAVFSPVRKVTYKVDNTRVGQVTDYDKLSLEVTTDGAVTPDDAVALAARILQDQLQLFINFEEPRVHQEEVVREDLPFNKNLLRKVDELELSRAFRELPEERQHHLYWRSGPENRGRNAAHPEFRSQISQRDQRGARSNGLAFGHGNRRLAARKHRGPGQEDGRPVLGSYRFRSKRSKT